MNGIGQALLDLGSRFLAPTEAKEKQPVTAEVKQPADSAVAHEANRAAGSEQARSGGVGSIGTLQPAGGAPMPAVTSTVAQGGREQAPATGADGRSAAVTALNAAPSPTAQDSLKTAVVAAVQEVFAQHPVANLLKKPELDAKLGVGTATKLRETMMNAAATVAPSFFAGPIPGLTAVFDIVAQFISAIIAPQAEPNVNRVESNTSATVATSKPAPQAATQEIALAA